MSDRYYIRIDGVNGDVTDKDFFGWFRLPEFLFEEVIATLFSGAKDASATGPSFSPLFLTLLGNTGLAPLLDLMSSGKLIPAIEIVGVSDSGGASITDYRLLLNNVAITNLSTGASDGPASGHSLTLDYEKLGLQLFETDSKGIVGLTEEFAWDRVAKAPTTFGKLVEPAAANAVSLVPDPTTYYVRIDGIAGDADAAGFEGWIELPSFDFTAFRAGASALDFTALSLVFASNTGLAELLEAGAAKSFIQSLQIRGVSKAGDGSLQTVYDLVLNDVMVTSVVDQSGSGYQVNVDYGRIGLVTTALAPDGKVAGQQEFGWDVAANNALDPALLSTPVSKAVDPVPEPLTYYIKIDGLEGDSTDANYAGWFKLSEFIFGQRTGTSFSSAGGGAVTEWSDLEVMLEGNSGLVSLLQKQATGAVIPAITIEGVGADGSGSGTAVYSLTLNNVLVSSLSFADEAGGKNSGFGVHFEYGTIGLETGSLDSSGTISSLHQFAWDLSRDAPAEKIIPPTTSGSGPAFAEADTYYIRLDGYAGDATQDGVRGWFELDSFSFANLTNGSKTDFGDIDVQIGSNGVLTQLLQDFASGRNIGAVEIIGFSNQADGPVEVFNLLLNSALVRSVTESGTGGGEETGVSASFAYRSIGFESTGYGSDGRLDATQSFAYDAAAATSISFGSLKVPTNSTADATPEPTRYFVRIDGIDGDVSIEGLVGAFELDSFSFEGNNSFSPGSASAFDSLNLALLGTTGVTELLQSGLSGSVIGAVDIIGVYGDGDGFTEVYRLTINDVTVNSVSSDDASGSNDTVVGLSLDYKTIGLETTAIRSDGSLGPTTEFAWDAGNNEAAVSLKHANSSLTQAEADPTTYFLKIDGVRGEAQQVGFEGAFALPALSFSVDLDGRIVFDPVSTSTLGDKALAILLDLSARGAAIGSVQIAGTIPGFLSDEPLYTLTLNDVFVSLVREDDSEGYEINFDFGKIAVVTQSYGLDGSFKGSTEFGWDVVRGMAISASSLKTPDPDPNAPPSVSIASQNLISDTGISASDLVTSDGAVSLTGVASDDVGVASVEIFDGAKSLGFATLVGQNWSFTTVLGEGSHSLYAVATDGAGLKATSAVQQEIIVDQSDPDLAVNGLLLGSDTGSGPEGESQVGNFTLAGTVSDAGKLANVAVFSGTTLLGYANIAAGNWSFDGVFKDGSYALSVVASDLAGNTWTIAGPNLHIDLATPSLAVDALDETTGIASGNTGGGVFTVDGRALLADESLVFDGADETDGTFLLYGGAGADRLRGSTGVDTMIGGLGDDAYYIDSVFDAVIENAGEGTDRIYTSINLNPFGDRYANVESFALTGAANALHGTKHDEELLANPALGSKLFGYGGADILRGSVGNDRLFGGSGNDVLLGNAGNDRIDGQTGADDMRGGKGDDNYIVDNAGDTVTELAGEGVDKVKSFVDFTLGAHVENLILVGSAAEGIGNDLGNTIFAKTTGAVLHGFGGDDLIRATQSADVIDGGDGNDTINGRGGNDTITGGNGDDELSGRGGDDTIDGGAGNDDIIGGADSDTIIGGADQDTMRGEGGADTFVFATGDFTGLSATTADRITDFDQAEGDLIDLSALDAIIGDKVDDAFTFIGGAGFSKTAGELRFEQADGNTMVYMDVDGDGAADYAIRLDGLVNLTEADFIL